MSWIENIKSELVITTGDGKEFKPFWKPSQKVVEYNIAEFEFPNLYGTLVKRGMPKGTRFNLEIYFQGENCVEEARAFEKSSNDSRAWIISHPYHESMIVHPASLTFDYSKYNIVTITGAVIETLTEDKPKISLSPADKISLDKERTDENFNNAFDATPSIKDVNTLTQNNSNIYKEGSRGIKNPIEAEAYFNAFSKANSAIANATAEPIAAMRAIQAMVNAPALFQQSVRSRISIFTNQFNQLRKIHPGITLRSTKKIYEHQGGALLSAQALAASTPITDDYGNKINVLAVVDEIISNYNQYILDLDELQSETGGTPTSYIPDADSLNSLTQLINYTISNLFNIALNAKQERIVYIEDDSNLILLAHRFYGLKEDDSTIEELKNNNAISLNEILQIKKGRKIIYYI